MFQYLKAIGYSAAMNFLFIAVMKLSLEAGSEIAEEIL